MTITASRLGSSPLTLDWSSLGQSHDKSTHQNTWDVLKTRFHSNDVGFYDSPVLDDLSQFTKTKKLADEVLSSGKFKTVLCLGIGGSSLGPITLLSALKHLTKTGLDILFVENPDPTEWLYQIQKISPESTLVVCIAKSGTTFETLALFTLALEWLGKSRWSSHAIAITDPKKGDLKKFATDHQLKTLDIAPSIGGRFSVFSPVGLLPLLLAGLDAESFLNGAIKVRDYCEKTPVQKNALFNIGAELIGQFKKRPIHVCMPYSTSLKSFGAWFTQLWAESLGKNGKGFTPIAALGAVDQHSILQLMRDGPDDKVTFFLKVETPSKEIRVPKMIFGLPAFEILENRGLHELLQIEYQAISLVMTKNERPHFTWSLEAIDEKNMGALLFASCVLTAFTGALWDVNPFDQPGVEEGKIYIRESLQKAAKQASEQSSEDADNSAYARLRTYANKERGNSDGDNHS